MNRHLDRFFRLKCGDRLTRFFPNSKEVTEAFAVYDAAKVVLGDEALHDSSILAICPGDGVSPRTGATVALRSAWTVKSVDPAMRVRWTRGQHKVKRLECVRGMAQDAEYASPRIVILATHSHAPLSSIVAKCRCDRLDVVSLPCCVPDDIGSPSMSWEDADCESPARRVNAYLEVPHA